MGDTRIDAERPSEHTASTARVRRVVPISRWQVLARDWRTWALVACAAAVIVAGVWATRAGAKTIVAQRELQQSAFLQRIVDAMQKYAANNAGVFPHDTTWTALLVDGGYLQSRELTSPPDDWEGVRCVYVPGWTTTELSRRAQAGERCVLAYEDSSGTSRREIMRIGFGTGDIERFSRADALDVLARATDGMGRPIELPALRR
jgi:hypothetical protein